MMSSCPRSYGALADEQKLCHHEYLHFRNLLMSGRGRFLDQKPNNESNLI